LVSQERGLTPHVDSRMSLGIGAPYFNTLKFNQLNKGIDI